MTAEITSEGRVEHRGHRTWWGVAGDETSRPALLTVHGGPGICHDCLEPLDALADERRVVFYDQLGCGRSERVADPQEYDVDLFVDEVGAVREELGLDEVHLFAHSYGGPIALEYLLRNPDSGVRSLTLANTFASVPGLAAGWVRRIAQLSEASQRALGGAPPDSGEYGAALGEFVGSFVLPFAPPEPLVRSQMGSGAEVYARMHGSSWFVPDGQWAGWDVTARLGEIGVPTLVVAGERDQVVPELGREIADGVPGARLEVLDAAHLPFFEVPADFLRLVRAHLREADGRAGHEHVEESGAH